VRRASLSYKGHRYPVEVISHCVWLHHRFPLSFREVEELMFERGVVVSYETVRRWCVKFGPAYAGELRRRLPRPVDKWLYLLEWVGPPVRRWGHRGELGVADKWLPFVA
jgi:putative transposase